MQKGCDEMLGVLTVSFLAIHRVAGCSDAALYVTGQVFVADGGQMVRGLLTVGEVKYVG
jgi:hypothetical protein